MPPSHILLFILMGLFAGTASGLVGIGGGIVLVPALIYFFGLTQHLAQGTTLAAMVPPIGLLAAYVYYRHGYVNLPMAGLICLGFFFGGFIGARFATALPHDTLRRLFGFVLLLIALHMIFTDK